jgi:hypothetical protein
LFILTCSLCAQGYCTAAMRAFLSLLAVLLVQRPAPVIPADAAAIDAIVSWLTEEGSADLTAVTVASGVGGERGVQTTRAIAAGEVILRGKVVQEIGQ